MYMFENFYERENIYQLITMTHIPSAPYNLYASFRPGIVTFATSWLNLMRGIPFISTSL